MTFADWTLGLPSCAYERIPSGILQFYILLQSFMMFRRLRCARGVVENLERQVQELSPEEWAAFREWFIAFDWEAWDQQLERDILAGKLEPFAEEALRDHARGKSTEL